MVVLDPRHSGLMCGRNNNRNKEGEEREREKEGGGEKEREGGRTLELFWEDLHPSYGTGELRLQL